MALPRVVITLGDPAGIGPEVVLKAVAARRVKQCCAPIVIGDKRLFLNKKGVFSFSGTFIDIPARGLEDVHPGIVSAVAGEAAYQWIRTAVRMIAAGRADALVTAPLSKEALHLAGHRYAGHTELLAKLTKTRTVAMLMAIGGVRSVMITRHIPLMAVAGHLSSQEIVQTVTLACVFLRRRAGLKEPRVTVCALNPHAGEGGLIGREETKIIVPAIRILRAAGIAASGPVPADTAWRNAREGSCDLVVTMYHDQTMIPLKMIAPEKIVNITAGLPFIRTSPGHGTAFDIAGKNQADPRPMIEAILAAARLQAGG